MRACLREREWQKTVGRTSASGSESRTRRLMFSCVCCCHGSEGDDGADLLMVYDLHTHTRETAMHVHTSACICV